METVDVCATGNADVDGHFMVTVPWLCPASMLLIYSGAGAPGQAGDQLPREGDRSSSVWVARLHH